MVMFKSRAGNTSLAVAFIVSAALIAGCSAPKMEQAAGMTELPRQIGDTKVPMASPYK